MSDMCITTGKTGLKQMVILGAMTVISPNLVLFNLCDCTLGGTKYSTNWIGNNLDW